MHSFILKSQDGLDKNNIIKTIFWKFLVLKFVANEKLINKTYIKMINQKHFFPRLLEVFEKS